MQLGRYTIYIRSSRAGFLADLSVCRVQSQDGEREYWNVAAAAIVA